MHFVFGFGEHLLRCLPHGVHVQHTHSGKKNLDERRRRIPQRRELLQLSVLVGMKHALVPAPRSGRVAWIIPDDVHEGLQRPKGDRLGVLRHEQNVTVPPVSHLVNEFRKRLGIRQVQYGARL